MPVEPMWALLLGFNVSNLLEPSLVFWRALKDLKPMGMTWAPMSAAWTPMRPGTSVSLGSDIGATACHRCHCSVTSVPGSLGLCSASCWLCDLSDAAFMTSPEVMTTSEVPSPGEFLFAAPMGTKSNHETDPNPCKLDDDFGAFATDERDDANAAFRDEDQGDAEKVFINELIAGRLDVTTTHSGVKGLSVGDVGPMILTRRARGPRSFPDNEDPRTTSSGPGRADDTDVVGTQRVEAEVLVGSGSGLADASSSSSSSDSSAFSDEDDDEDMFVEVERTKKAKKVKKKARAKCLLWFPLPRFLIRLLAVHGVCLAQINPSGIRHLLGIYVLSRECGVDISTKNLSYLTDFRTRGLSEELKHSVTNSLGMVLIAGFPSKDDHFEYRFFFAEISERTVKADCINFVKTRWERRVKPTLPKVSKEFLAAMHKDLSSGNGNWKRLFSRKRIERALSAEILPGKILGRGQARLSLREQIALEAAAKARGYSGTGAPKVAMPTTSTPPSPSMRARTSRPSTPKTALPPPSLGDVAEFRRLSAERAGISSGKGKGVDRVTPSKRQRVDAFPAAAVGREASASGGNGLLRDEAYSVVKSRYSELSLLFDRLVGDYDKDVRSRGSELYAAKEANAAIQSRLDETVERNEALEHDALALHRRSRIDAAVAEARDEMTRSFAERISEGSDPPDLPPEVKTLRERRHRIYDAHDVFADFLASVRRVLEIIVVPAGVTETSAAVDDDVEMSDEDDVEATDDDEGTED
ncbi:hypothetical protein AALP_AA2G042400 [Arabis alpina]|uniref:DUF1204 domain-containing protein n=1 Tax=Arabis alpina TaxID=50452 RepID=A0A087HF96_ARAAL|nr:hypothetical protein AALP_AA2G042400 [Arabis alpina]